MTKLVKSPYNDLCRIDTDSYVLKKWVAKSPSRVYMKLEKEWAYPITEIRDIAEFCQKTGEPIEMDQYVSEEFTKFSTKVEIIRRIRDGAITKFDITKPALFKEEFEEKYKYQYGVISQMLLMRQSLLVLEVGMGKAQPLYSSVLTPRGFTQMGRLHVGDSITGADGKPYKVTGVFPQGNKKVFELLFSDGATVRCSDEHLWPVYDKNRWFRKQDPYILTLSELVEKFKTNKHLYFRPAAAAEFTQDNELPVSPYLLGALLGDGGLSIKDRVTFTTADAQMLSNVTSTLPQGLFLKRRGRYDYGIRAVSGNSGGNTLLRALKLMGLAGKKSYNKFIPAQYLLSGRCHRLALLQGLMDTDGHISKDGTRVEFSTSSRQLKADMVSLIQSLGGIAKVTSKIPTFIYKGVRKRGARSYRIGIILPEGVVPVSLSRKVDRLSVDRKYFPIRRLKKITYVGIEPCQCISVSAPDHLYVTDNYIVTHNTLVSLFAILKLRETTNVSALIVCESNQIHKPWLDTLLKFTDIKDYLIVEGDADERAKKIAYGKAHPEKYWLWIVSYDTVRIEYENLPKQWTVMILDEITKVKNVSTDAFQALYELDATYKFGLSATPVMNTYFDLYGVMKTVNSNVFTNKQNFMDRYLDLDFFGNPKGLKTGMEEELKRKIYPWTIQLKKSDVGLGQDKPKEIVSLPIPLTELQKKELERIYGEIASGERTAFESGTILRQICNTLAIASEVVPVLDREGNPEVNSKGEPRTKSRLLYPDIPLPDSTNKIQALKDLIKQTVDVQKKKVVVFSFFKTAINLLEKELEGQYRVKTVTGDSARGCKYPSVVNCKDCPKYRYCKMLKKEIYEFVEGDVQILLGTDSLSRAHNLYTCDTIINFDLPWSSADLEQRMGRIDRGNNTAPVFFIYNLVTLGTIEERIIKIIETKQKEAGKVFPEYNVKLGKLSKTIQVK